MIENRKSFEKWVKRNEKRIDGIYIVIGDNYSRSKTVKVKELKRTLNQFIGIAKFEKTRVHGHICWNGKVNNPSYLGFRFTYYD